ncbi:FxDxF family PEP-CTERM protein [Thiobacillus sedimenti]|uniref:FxDxF family PEP-CTERM protein n=2 Tax=Thiobacillus sedimenti TaxID=3110231 RepID=A0ABZ1CN37_9PROT|nr:FxDxF family PEP-CTERM protein [Thiobacillus sp. SCUT-2]WRS40702.1 FxDxF family PEP-CTERM protein [Thiobacillus sp. SCUT-2]
MAHLFFTELGNRSAYSTSGTFLGLNTTLATGPFTNLQAWGGYWYGTLYAPDPSQAWYLSTNWGSQDRAGLTWTNIYALPFRPGDIANLLPVSLIGGPYSINQGTNLLLNGAASYDPDYVADSIIQYAWDLNGDATYDVFGATPDVDYATLVGLGMGTGTYTMSLKVTDTHGTYGVSTATLTIAAVPEPETYAMMLIGVGIVGMAARRRL